MNSKVKAARGRGDYLLKSEDGSKTPTGVVGGLPESPSS